MGREVQAGAGRASKCLKKELHVKNINLENNIRATHGNW